MKNILITFFLFLSTVTQAHPAGPPKLIKNTYKVTYGGNDRFYEIEFLLKENDPETNFYRTYYGQGNPFIPYPFCIMKDTVKQDGKTIYSETYHTGVYGLRQTPNKNPEAPNHLIMSGDSNMFGIGVADDQTLPARIGLKSSTHTAYNLGLAGTGPNSALYFLQYFDLSKLIGNKKKGIFLYDFHYYLFERVIGSKAYMAWSVNPPRYALENGEVVYKGPFSKYWITKFYQFLNSLPYNTTLFPNLPRIGKDHIEFSAKVLAQMKKEYLRQTDKDNRFIISINPKYDNFESQKNVRYFMECLKKEKIEFISFEPSEILDLPQIVGEGHFDHTAHENYSKMLLKKLSTDIH